MKSKFPKKIAKSHEILSRDFVWLAFGWRTYKFLYLKEQRQLDLLNEVAGSYFFVSGDAMYDGMAMGVCRLADRAVTGSGKIAKKNLTLATLVQQVEDDGEIKLAKKLDRLRKTIAKKADRLFTYRHKSLGHKDFNRAMRKTARALPARADVDRVFELIAEFLNALARAYGHPETYYEHVIADGQVDALVAVLHAGLRYHELMEKGVIPLTDDPHAGWTAK